MELHLSLLLNAYFLWQWKRLALNFASLREESIKCDLLALEHSRRSVWLALVSHQHHHLKSETSSPNWEEVSCQVCLQFGVGLKMQKYYGKPLLPSWRKHCWHPHIQNGRWKWRRQESANHLFPQTPENTSCLTKNLELVRQQWLCVEQPLESILSGLHCHRWRLWWEPLGPLLPPTTSHNCKWE